jgi:hypothetical protein
VHETNLIAADASQLLMVTVIKVSGFAPSFFSALAVCTLGYNTGNTDMIYVEIIEGIINYLPHYPWDAHSYERY